jgi:aldose 1-epimerase
VGLQVYTGSSLPNLNANQCTANQIRPNAGIALEAQGWPDAPNKPTFPSIMLEASETYRQITRYTFTQK